MAQLIDLHIHSRCSDGVYSPQQLVEKAAQAGVVTLAVCDHDNIDGVEVAREVGQQCGVQVISGVELSCIWSEYKDIHLLGYGFDCHYAPLQQALQSFQQFRAERNKLIVDKINTLLVEKGLPPLVFERVEARADGTVGRPHIAMELMEAGHAKTMEDAFNQYLVPCNIPKRFFPVDEAIDLIHAAGGVAVLAHPPYVTRDCEKMEKLLKELVAVGLNGIEVYNNGANSSEIEWYLTQARLRQLLVTGGSDFHGIEEGGAELGKIRAIGSIPTDCAEELLKRITEN